MRGAFIGMHVLFVVLCVARIGLTPDPNWTTVVYAALGMAHFAMLVAWSFEP